MDEVAGVRVKRLDLARQHARRSVQKVGDQGEGALEMVGEELRAVVEEALSRWESRETEEPAPVTASGSPVPWASS